MHCAIETTQINTFSCALTHSHKFSFMSHFLLGSAAQPEAVGLY